MDYNYSIEDLFCDFLAAQPGIVPNLSFQANKQAYIQSLSPDNLIRKYLEEQSQNHIFEDTFGRFRHLPQPQVQKSSWPIIVDKLIRTISSVNITDDVINDLSGKKPVQWTAKTINFLTSFASSLYCAAITETEVRQCPTWTDYKMLIGRKIRKPFSII